MKHTRHLISLAFAALALFCAADVTRDTEWQDVPPETRVGTVLDLGGGGGGGVDTNAVRDIADVQITNHVTSGYLCTVAAAKEKADAAEAAAKEYTDEKASNITFGQLKSKPTSLSGYGITDAYTKEDVNGTSVTNGGAVAYINDYAESASNYFAVKEGTGTGISGTGIGTIGKTFNVGNNKKWGVDYADTAKNANAISDENGSTGSFKFFGFENKNDRCNHNLIYKNSKNNPTVVKTNAWISDVIQSTNCLIAANVATNIAENVVGEHLYYSSTNLADNVELRLFSGEWVNAEYDGVGTADVVLDLTGVANDKVTDTLMVLNCAATGTLTVATSDTNECRVVRKKGVNPLELKAGLNLLTFSRYRLANGTNEVLVTNNELE